jgi:hypothetical protein
MPDAVGVDRAEDSISWNTIPAILSRGLASEDWHHPPRYAG